MLRHSCLRNEQDIVAIKETLSQLSYHTEGKKMSQQKNMMSELKQE